MGLILDIPDVLMVQFENCHSLKSRCPIENAGVSGSG
jgi:hypothetical protein